jgi:sortase A
VRVSRDNALLKVGVALMALAVALVIAAVVVTFALRSEPERVVAAEVAATKSLDEPQLYSPGEEGSAIRKSSFREKEPARYPSGEEESLGYDSSPSYGGPVGQREEKAEEPQPVAAASLPELPKSEPAQAQPAPQRTPSEPSSEPDPQPQQHQPQPEEQPLPGAEEDSWPEPTPQEIESANSPRHYGLLPGAIMGLTIEDIGIYDAPVFNSDGPWALASGIAHVPETSLPWSNTPQRNVYLAGHRMGYRGTWSRMIFYNLDKLGVGDRILLKDRSGRAYEYEVSEVFLAEPGDSWVMGQVRARDMVTLQTCTPIPTFEKRLIVRADRI